MYVDTQASLTEKKASTEVPLLRGLQESPEMPYYPSALEAWTSDPETAALFAKNKEDAIIEAELPRSRIFLWHSGPGWRSASSRQQFEYIVLSEDPS
jgi:hypothetical protein